jgi:rubredoxin-NAD+ reductase
LHEIDAGLEARFEDERGALRGFALLGAATARKNALARLLPPLFG